MTESLNVETLQDHFGKEIGVSPWKEINQDRIDAFADCTEDHQYIHVNPEQAANSPFGGTIAHGFLSLSMLSVMAYSVPPLTGVVMGVNYGFEKVRFLQPVKSGQSVRGRFTLKNAIEKGPGRWLLTYDVTVEIEGETKPALVAEWLGMQVLGQNA